MRISKIVSNLILGVSLVGVNLLAFNSINEKKLRVCPEGEKCIDDGSSSSSDIIQTTQLEVINKAPVIENNSVVLKWSNNKDIEGE